MAAIHKTDRNRGLVLDNRPFKVKNTDRETVASLGAKLRTALADIDGLKKRVGELEERVEELEQGG